MPTNVSSIDTIQKQNSTETTNATTPKITLLTEKEYGEILRESCIGCRLTMRRLTRTRCFDTEAKQQIADILEVKSSSAISGSLHIYDPKHPLIKKERILFNEIYTKWRTNSIPLSAASADDYIEPGVRLIRKDEADKFNSYMLHAVRKVHALEKELNRERSDILRASRRILGKRFSESLFPAKFSLYVNWGFPVVDIPHFQLEAISPAAYQHELENLRQQFQRTAELAVETLLCDLYDIVSMFARITGPVITLDIPENHILHKYNGATLLRTITPINDKNIPDKHVKIVLRHNDTVITTESISDNDFSTIKQIPDESKQYRFKATSIQEMFNLLHKFSMFNCIVHNGSKLTSTIETANNRLKQLLNTDNINDMAKTLRENENVKNTVHILMKNIEEQLNKHITTEIIPRRKI